MGFGVGSNLVFFILQTVRRFCIPVLCSSVVFTAAGKRMQIFRRSEKLSFECPVALIEATVSVKTSFNDQRCAGGMVCPNDSLLFVCTITDTPLFMASITFPVGNVNIRTENGLTTLASGLLPGVTVRSYDAEVDEELANYTITLAFQRASLLTGSIICDGLLDSAVVEATCQTAEGNT